MAEPETVPAYAHSRNAHGVRQELREHLEAVAGLAADYADAFGAGHLARAAGLWHDLGKYNPEFQRYLIESEAGQRARGTGPDHKAAGTLLAAQLCQPLAPIIAGHHGGLKDLADLKGRLSEWGKQAAPSDALRRAAPDLQQPPCPTLPPAFVRSTLATEFFIRMLFSTLVDADYLDTEQHIAAERAAARQGSLSLSELWERFRRYHDTLTGGDGPVNALRAEVYAACLQAAELPPGLFRLTVPTGGGKTLSGMAFALRHALCHDLRRVIIGVPYTTITEQTARVYREVFGSDRAVLEHHSAIDPAGVDDQTDAGLWGRLAAENWDEPIVVTTTVQLFESIFARSTNRCRKLHRLARSVIILDEVQTLPPHLLAPILDALTTLTTQYGTTVVLCTATQPALDDSPEFKGLVGVREIAPDPRRLFAALRRVNYELPAPDELWSWEQAAVEMQSSPQALAIVNTVKDALALFDALDDPDAFHLSTRLCGAHRRQVLAEVKRRLRAGEPCRLVSTQVVESGVDVDFPLVLRAVGPLDRIVQAAGRCNREGRLAMGRVVVFDPADGSLPPGAYRTATQQSAMLLRKEGADLHDPALYQKFFSRLYDKLNLDREEIQDLRAHLRYEEVAKKFQMIDDNTISVVVRYDVRAERLLEQARQVRFLSRDLLRALQPYMVSIFEDLAGKYRARGMIEEVREGLCAWAGEYDQRRGLQAENRLLLA